MSLSPKPRDPSQSRRERIQFLLRSSGQPELTEEQASRLVTYLDLLLRWNAKINLTGIRNEEDILRRHFLESIQCARLLPPGIQSLLDFGSGAGFPGVPCAICRPEVSVTLAESQAKKAAFLRETVRSLGLRATVYPGRVEDQTPENQFHAVTLRAVDRMLPACMEAVRRTRAGGWLIVMATEKMQPSIMTSLEGVAWRNAEPVPGSDHALILVGRKLEEALD